MGYVVTISGVIVLLAIASLSSYERPIIICTKTNPRNSSGRSRSRTPRPDGRKLLGKSNVKALKTLKSTPYNRRRRGRKKEGNSSTSTLIIVN